MIEFNKQGAPILSSAEIRGLSDSQLSQPCNDIETSNNPQSNLLSFRSYFVEHFNHLMNLSFVSIDQLFLNFPPNVLPIDSSTNKPRPFTSEETISLIQTFVEIAEESGFIESCSKYPLTDQPQRIRVSTHKLVDLLITELRTGLPIEESELASLLHPDGSKINSPYLLLQTPTEMTAIANEQVTFLHRYMKENKDRFTIYLARDSAPLFQVHSYLSHVDQASTSSGLIYHGGLKVRYIAVTDLNKLVESILEDLTQEFLEPPQIEDDKEWRSRDEDGMALDYEAQKIRSKKDWRLRSEFKNLTDNEVFQEFQERFTKRIHSILDELSTKQEPTLFRLARDLYQQVKDTGILKADPLSVTFFDTSGTGKSVLLAKSIFEYFAKKDVANIPKSDVFIIRRFSNYTDCGQSRIPGMPCLLDENKEKTKPDSTTRLAAESDIQPFFAAHIDDNGMTLLCPNSLPGQVMCLLRSIINWNSVVNSKST